jgi:hypothetical protein
VAAHRGAPAASGTHPARPGRATSKAYTSAVPCGAGVTTVRVTVIPGSCTSASASDGSSPPSGSLAEVTVSERVYPAGSGNCCGSEVRASARVIWPVSVDSRISAGASSAPSAGRLNVTPAARNGRSVSSRHHTGRGSPSRWAGRQAVPGSPSTAAHGAASGRAPLTLSGSEAELEALGVPPS